MRTVSFVAFALVTLACSEPLPPHAPAPDALTVDAGSFDTGTIIVDPDAQQSFDSGQGTNDGGVIAVDSFFENDGASDDARAPFDDAGSTFDDAGDVFDDAGTTFEDAFL